MSHLPNVHNEGTVPTEKTYFVMESIAAAMAGHYIDRF